MKYSEILSKTLEKGLVSNDLKVKGQKRFIKLTGRGYCEDLLKVLKAHKSQVKITWKLSCNISFTALKQYNLVVVTMVTDQGTLQ